MFWWVRQLGACFYYIRIKDGDSLYYSKRMFDLLLPTACAALSIAVHWFLCIAPHLFGEWGILTSFANLFEVLVPFFLASLAAVATFGSDKLDMSTRGSKATLIVRSEYGGLAEERELSRLQFMCCLFGYLCALTLIVLVITIIVGALSGAVTFAMPAVLMWTGAAAAYLVLWHIFFVTLLSIYFLTDRLHAH